jgi:hypothetical protein
MTPPIAAPSIDEISIGYLLDEFTDAETQRLVRGAIERALSQGKHLSDLQGYARDLGTEADARKHASPAPCVETPQCHRCFLEMEEQRALRLIDRQRLLLMGKAVAA